MAESIMSNRMIKLFFLMTFNISILLNHFIQYFQAALLKFVVPSRIELEYQVPETCVLSIVLRDQFDLRF